MRKESEIEFESLFRRPFFHDRFDGVVDVLGGLNVAALIFDGRVFFAFDFVERTKPNWRNLDARRLALGRFLLNFSRLKVFPQV